LLFKNSHRRNSHFESIINSSIGLVEVISSKYFLHYLLHCVFFLFAFTYRRFSLSFRFSCFLFIFLFFSGFRFCFRFPSVSVSVSFSFTISLFNILNRLDFLLLSVKAVLPKKFTSLVYYLFDSLFCFLLVVFFFFNWHTNTVGLIIPSWLSSSIFNFNLRFRTIIQASEPLIVIIRTSALSLRLIYILRLFVCSYEYELIILLVIIIVCGVVFRMRRRRAGSSIRSYK